MGTAVKMELDDVYKVLGSKYSANVYYWLNPSSKFSLSYYQFFYPNFIPSLTIISEKLCCLCIIILGTLINRLMNCSVESTLFYNLVISNIRLFSVP